MARLTSKELKELQRLNAVVKAIGRVIDFGLQLIDQATTDDLKRLRAKVCARRKELIG